MEEIIKELEQIGKELFSKYGVDSYNTRCKLHDAREKLKALTIHSVVPMLPKMKSNEFESFIKSSGYERIDDELLQKGTDYYCVNNVYRHFLNLIEFGN